VGQEIEALQGVAVRQQDARRNQEDDQRHENAEHGRLRSRIPIEHDDSRYHQGKVDVAMTSK
jgi:hypothetical protein